jgi:hypothetical protein
MLARYASKFSVRAIDLNIDSSLLWVGAALAIVAAVTGWAFPGTDLDRTSLSGLQRM